MNAHACLKITPGTVELTQALFELTQKNELTPIELTPGLSEFKCLFARTLGPFELAQGRLETQSKV